MKTRSMVRRARAGRAGVRMGECGGHVEGTPSEVSMKTTGMVRRARGGRAGVRMGECGGHVEAPAAE